jgi:hypothetical protein
MLRVQGAAAIGPQRYVPSYSTLRVLSLKLNRQKLATRIFGTVTTVFQAAVIGSMCRSMQHVARMAR